MCLVLDLFVYFHSGLRFSHLISVINIYNVTNSQVPMRFRSLMRPKTHYFAEVVAYFCINFRGHFCLLGDSFTNMLNSKVEG